MNLFGIAVGALLGAWSRWGLSLLFNPLFPTIPLGTLFSNLIGGFLIGIFMGFTRNSVFFPEVLRLAIVTGFLGGLTTFSTFSAESVNLFSHQQYGWGFLHIASHLFGTLVCTTIGIFFTKLFVGST